MERVLEKYAGGKIPVEIGKIREVEVLSYIDGGGFGSVWRVADTNTGAVYALKIMEKIAPDSTLKERIRREAAVRIPSDHIVHPVGLSTWDATTYLILFDYFESKTLADLIREGALSDEQKLSILTQSMRGISDAHKHNVIHRDIKPGNILVNSAGLAKLIDFGISKFKGVPITMDGQIIGTVPYIALELLVSGTIKFADARSDIYSLGHVAYELAMGQHYWTRAGWTQISDLVAYLSRKPAPTVAADMSDFRCSYMPHGGALVSRMLMIDPKKRFGSVDEIMERLGIPVGRAPLPVDIELRSPMLIVESGTIVGARTVVGIEPGQKRSFGRADIDALDHYIGRSDHFEISRIESRYLIRDLGSKHGTMVDAKVLGSSDPPLELHHGDRIKIGETYLRFAFLRDPVTT